MFEEDDGIFRPGSGFKKTLGIFSATRKHDLPARDMSEKAFDASRMPGATLDIPADWNSDDYRTRPHAVAPPAYGRDFIS
jgi:hypothetical protein